MATGAWCSYPLSTRFSETRNRWRMLVVRADSLRKDAEASRLSMGRRFNRRFAIGVLSAAGLGIGANFLGVTSLLLGTNPALARSLRLDVVYPVQGFFRCLDRERGFEFIYPQNWVGDRTILYKTIERSEELQNDLPRLKPKPSVMEPVAAFGPPGTKGEVNVSVIVSPARPGFRLEELGDAKQAGESLLSKFIAPRGSDKVATLVDAAQRRDAGDMVYYTLEYTVRAPKFFRHNVAVYATAKGRLFSLNAQTPEADWSSRKEQFLTMASSFNLI